MHEITGMGQRLRRRLADGTIIVAPGIYDHMSLLMAQEAGCEAVYASGYWGTASALGEPDVGIAGAADFVRIFGGFAQKSAVPVIADADTGFGSLVNLQRAVRAYARGGIAAMQIEDQPFPKICGHVGRAVSVPVEDMCRRMNVAREALDGGDMLIIGRTDARRSEGLDAALDRLRAYAGEGADIVFLEGPQSAAEIERAASTIDAPLLINAAHGGVTPILTAAEYAELGAAMVIYPAGPALSAAQAALGFYRGLLGGDARPAGEGMFPFGDMTRLLGMDDVVALQERHGGA